jgi:hypothetical protein
MSDSAECGDGVECSSTETDTPVDSQDAGFAGAWPCIRLYKTLGDEDFEGFIQLYLLLLIGGTDATGGVDSSYKSMSTVKKALCWSLRDLDRGAVASVTHTKLKQKTLDMYNLSDGDSAHRPLRSRIVSYLAFPFLGCAPSLRRIYLDVRSSQLSESTFPY